MYVNPMMQCLGHSGNLLPAFVLLGLTGMIIYAGHTSNVIMGHRIVPEMTSTISGILMGFAWAIANFSQPIIAVLSGKIPGLPGLLSGLTVVLIFPLAAAALALLLPKEKSDGSPKE